MSDLVDDASDREALDRNLALAVRKPVPLHDGRCLNCGEEIPGACYCDADCKLDHEAREAAQRRNGVAA